MRPLAAAVGAALLAAGVVAAQSPVSPLPGAPVRLADVSAAAGLSVTHANGAAGKKLLPETMGSGSAFVDVDGDGDQDLILVSGVWPPSGSAYARLFVNDGRGKFVEATTGSGLDRRAVASAAAPGALEYGMWSIRYCPRTPLEFDRPPGAELNRMRVDSSDCAHSTTVFACTSRVSRVTRST